MNKIAFIIAQLLLFSLYGRAAMPIDTIGFQIAYYNGKEIAKCSDIVPHCPIVIKLDSIQPTDSLGFLYATDSFCDCEQIIMVQNDKHHVVCRGKSVGDYSITKVSLWEIKQFVEKSCNKDLPVFHLYNTAQSRSDLDMIFRLKFE